MRFCQVNISPGGSVHLACRSELCPEGPIGPGLSVAWLRKYFRSSVGGGMRCHSVSVRSHPHVGVTSITLSGANGGEIVSPRLVSRTERYREHPASRCTAVLSPLESTTSTRRCLPGLMTAAY